MQHLGAAVGAVPVREGGDVADRVEPRTVAVRRADVLFTEVGSGADPAIPALRVSQAA